MSAAQYDFILVGAGSNALTAAAYLGKAGNSVLVLEKHDHIGGGCVSREVTLPGFKHDTHATNLFLVKANPLIKNDELELLSRFGMDYIKTDAAYHGSLFDDGSVIEVFTDLEATCESIAAISPADALAYREFGRKAAECVDLLSWGMFAPPANPETFVEVLRQSPQGSYMLDLMTSSAWDLIQKTFTDERVKTHLYRKTSEMMISVEKPGTAFAMFTIVGFSHRYTSGFAVGGSQTFSDSLARCIHHHGGEIRTGAEVDRLLRQGNRVTGVRTAHGEEFYARHAVIASLPPWLLGEFLDDFDPALTAAAAETPPSDFGVFLSSYALKENMQLNFAPRFGKIQINQLCKADTGAVRQLYADLLDNKMPSHYFANAICATILDPSRAPDGHGTLYLYHMVPMKPDGDANNWDHYKVSFAKWLRENSAPFINNLNDDNILGEHHESPKDMAAYNSSFRYGDVMGAGTYAEQFLGGRPCKEFADFRVPGLDGLYLCGPFMHPGGGVCGGGRAVAMKAMFDLGMNLDAAFTVY